MGNRARLGASLGAIAVASFGVAGPAHAGAFYLADQSTKATGRAYSGETAERGAQQQWWNPAAVGGITGIQNYVGFTAILPYARATADRTNPTTVTRPALLGGGNVPVTGSDQRNPVNKGYLPNGGMAAPITDKIAFGFTVTSPYSFTTNYDKDFWGRYGADKSRLRTFDLQPVIAFAPSSHVSFGAGPNVEYMRATLSNYLPDPLSTSYGFPATPYSDGHQYLKGHAWDVGYSLGFQYHDDKVDIGASYKSAIKHHLKGHLIIDQITDPLATITTINQRVDNARAAFTTPWQVSVGLRYHVTPQFTLNTQIARFGWERFDAIYLYDLGPVIPNQKIVENYKNTFAYSVGFDYDLSKTVTLRGGVTRDQSPILDGYRDPRVPDGNRWVFAGGATLALNDFMGIDFAASYAKIAGNPINNTAVLFGGTLIQETSAQHGYLGGAHAILMSVGAHLAI